MVGSGLAKAGYLPRADSRRDLPYGAATFLRPLR